MRLLAAIILAAAPGVAAAQPDRSLPTFFFPSSGQAGPSEYLVQTPDLSARFRRDGAIFQVHQQRTQVRFAGGNPNVAIDGLDPLPAKVNFFLGTDGWKTGVPSYSKIVYRNLYPGIDMTYGGAGRQVKSEFLVAPGANPDLIRLEYSEAVSIDRQGNLIAGDFREAAPEVYQQTGSSRLRIKGRYRLIDAHTIGFEIGSYNASAPLVIDPTISYCTYLGGSGTTSITGVAVDSSDNLYVTGWTEAINFPIAGALDASNQGGVDVIVAKLNSAGTALLYATYIGGRSNDQGAAIAVDSSGEAYVTGQTSSSNFPLVSSNRATFGGTTNAFALKLNAAGNALIYSGYIGGTTYDVGSAIAVDSSANAYIAGSTQSSNFPLFNATQPTLGGGTDAFVTKLNSAGAITFSTFLGGSGNDEAGGIAVDALGDIFVAGGTSSVNFPVVAAYQGTLSGSEAAFVTKISFSGTVAFSTYLGGGGSAPQQANAIALDSAGNPYIAGVTTATNFPVTSGAFQTALSGSQNAFVTKMTSTGQSLAYSTYLGGAGYDWASGIAVSSAGNAYVTGYTSSANFPQASAVQSSFGGLYDAFVSELNFSGNAVTFSTFYGGSGSDAAYAIAIDSNANIFIAGETGSSNLNLVSPIQSSLAASSSGWVLRLGVTAAPPSTPSATSVSPTSGSGSTVTFTAQYADTGGGSTITSAALLVNTSASTGFGCYVSYNPGLNLFSIYTDAGTAVLSTVGPGGASVQNDQCTLNGTGSSASVSGTTLTVTFSLTFQPGFAGSDTVYLLAADSSSNTGWVAKGSFTVTIPSGTPEVNSVTPNGSSGSSQTFTFVYSDTIYAQNLTGLGVLFNTSSSSVTNACYISVNLTNNTVSLYSNNAQSTTSMAIGASGPLSNSQCKISANSSVQTGLSIVFTVSISFLAAFDGLQNIYMSASVGSLNTGWILQGTYSVAIGGDPLAVSAVPGSGSGPAERFSFTISDPGGASYLNSAAILFASTFNTTNACYLIWDGTHNTISLTYDNPANGQTPFTPGASGIATNEQCTMNAANSTVIVGATQVIITLDLTFNSTFAGAKNIYLYAAEASANSGWSTVGSWTVTGGAASALSVSPPSGSGTTTTFTFTVSDSNSQTNLSGMTMLFTSGAPTNIANACYLVYTRTINTSVIGLWDNTGGATLGTKSIGSSATLENSQCAVGYTFESTSGDTMSLQIQLVFFAAFAGTQSIYLEANEPSENSGFVYQGSWTVP